MTAREQRFAEMVHARAALDLRIRRASIGIPRDVVRRIQGTTARRQSPDELRAYYTHLNNDTDELTAERREALAADAEAMTRAAKRGRAA